MQDSTADSCLAVPKSCDINASFNFLGNKVTSGLSLHYDCPDSVVQHVRSSGNPIVIYARRDTTHADTIKGNAELVELKDAAWDFIGDHLLSRKEARFSNVRIDMSPLINPLYLGYSHSKGLSYKVRFRGEYTFRNHTAITLKPTVGYNFKLHQFFATVPLRYTFSPSRRDWVELEWANGNRIHDSKVLGHFDDQKLRLEGNVSATRWLDISAGLVYHRREAVDDKQMMAMGHETLYNSFAPVLQLTLTPLKFGPVFTARYERSIEGVMKSNMEFEKAELDMSYKKDLGSLRRYSLRAGGGYYFNMKTTYFIDFVNFHENYLPDGWDDDWEGQFQLLKSRWYNSSRYYLRFNASYESPLMALAHLPWVGRYVETERLYFSALSIEHARPYTEWGYAFTNRYFSAGIFAGFLNEKFEEVGFKFSLELFRHW